MKNQLSLKSTAALQIIDIILKWLSSDRRFWLYPLKSWFESFFSSCLSTCNILKGEQNWKTGQVKAIIFGWREGVEEWNISHSHCKPVAFFFFSSRGAHSKHSVFWSPDLLSPIPSRLCQLWGCFLASTSTCQLISQGGIFITCFNCSNQSEITCWATTRFHSVSATSTFKSASWKG